MRANQRHRKEARRQRATERQLLKVIFNEPHEQIARLDARLGEGVGAVKERTRLQREEA